MTMRTETIMISINRIIPAVAPPMTAAETLSLPLSVGADEGVVEGAVTTRVDVDDAEIR